MQALMWIKGYVYVYHVKDGETDGDIRLHVLQFST